jgi:vancomycin resistance protein VanJ
MSADRGRAQRASRRLGIVLLGAGSALSLLLGVTSSLDHLDVVPPGSFFYGFDFLSPLWLGILTVPLAAGWWIGGRPGTARALALAYLGYLLCFGDISLSPLLNRPVLASPGAGGTVSVVASNVRFYRHGVERVISGLESAGADIWLLSESPLTTDRRRELQAALPDRTVLSGQRADVAIVTRLPVRAVREVGFPTGQTRLGRRNDPARVERAPRRAFLHAELESGGVTLHVIAARLSAGRAPSSSLADLFRWSRYLVEAQRREMRALTRYIEGLAGPVIVGGDLNAPPRSKTVRPLRDIAQDSRYADHVWGQRTFPAFLPWTRIDYLFGTNGALPLSSRTLEGDFSDHLPVAAAFHVEAPLPLAGQAATTPF